MVTKNIASPTIEPVVEARHLRRLLDTQPSCLLRVSSYGEILAANDAALELLGAARRSEALGRAITKWMPDHIDTWREFLARVVAGAPASIETCLLTGGLYRNTLLHGVPLPDPPDGVASILISAHDISERVLLAATLDQVRTAKRSTESPTETAARDEQLRQALAALAEAKQRADAMATEQRRLESESGELRARIKSVDSERSIALEELAQAKDALRQADDHIQELTRSRATEEATGATAPADWQERLQTAEAERDQLRSELTTAQAEVETHRKTGAEAADQAARVLQALDAQEHQCDAAVAQRIQAEATLTVREAELLRVSGECEALRAKLTESTAERRRLAAQVIEAEARLEQLSRQVASNADHAEELRAQTAAARAHADELQQARSALAEREARLVPLAAERDEMVTRLNDAVAERRRLEDQLQAADARYQQVSRQLAAKIGQTEEIQQLQSALEERQSRLAQTLAERAEMVARLNDAEAARGRLEEHVRVAEARCAQLAQEKSEMARASEDAQRLQVLLEMASKQHQDLQTKLQEAERLCVERQEQLDRAAEEQRSLRAHLKTIETVQKDQEATYMAERARLDRLVTEAESAGNKHAEAVANREVVLAAMAEQTRRMAPLAATGSVARGLAPQIQEVIERVDVLAGRILEVCRQGTPGRADAESLRVEAVRAGALTTELLRAGAEPETPRVIVDRRKPKTGDRL